MAMSHKPTYGQRRPWGDHFRLARHFAGMPIFCLWGCPVAASVVLTDCFCRSVIAFQLTPDQTVLVGLGYT
jgi:hypothetical protein